MTWAGMVRTFLLGACVALAWYARPPVARPACARAARFALTCGAYYCSGEVVFPRSDLPGSPPGGADRQVPVSQGLPRIACRHRADPRARTGRPIARG